MPTKISWADETLNIHVGCKKYSDGCKECYAVPEANRMAGNPRLAERYAGLTFRHANGKLDFTGKVEHFPERIDLPSHWRDPRRIFIDSLSDFAEFATDEEYRLLWAMMAECARHRFMILTKRPHLLGEAIARLGLPTLPNVWLGVSVERQAYTFRIPILLAIPAARHFLSCEPLLGAIDLAPYLATGGIDQVIAGAESKRSREGRRMNLDHVRLLRDDCQRYGVAFFFKQAFEDGRKVERPFLDGRQWLEEPD
jgi:protein gp37